MTDKWASTLGKGSGGKPGGKVGKAGENVEKGVSTHTHTHLASNWRC